MVTQAEIQTGARDVMGRVWSPARLSLPVVRSPGPSFAMLIPTQPSGRKPGLCHLGGTARGHILHRLSGVGYEMFSREGPTYMGFALACGEH